MELLYSKRKAILETVGLLQEHFGCAEPRMPTRDMRRDAEWADTKKRLWRDLFRVMEPGWKLSEAQW